jgi:hypothetical protein
MSDRSPRRHRAVPALVLSLVALLATALPAAFDAGAIFDEQAGRLPVHRGKHPGDQLVARRDDRPDHDRMLDEAPQELPARMAGPPDTADLAL